jgi:hypothetical protein
LEHGADAKAKNSDGKQAIDYAEQRPSLRKNSVIELLK